jgi:hypothetical protein
MRWAMALVRSVFYCADLLRLDMRPRPYGPLTRLRQRFATVGSRSIYCVSAAPKRRRPPTSMRVDAFLAIKGRNYVDWWTRSKANWEPFFGPAHRARSTAAASVGKQVLGRCTASYTDNITEDKATLGRTGSCTSSLRRKPYEPDRQLGEVSWLLLCFASLVIGVGVLTMWGWICKSTQRHLSLFDDEPYSPLYCGGTLSEALRTAKPPGQSVRAFATDRPCVMRRSDYAATGSDLSLAPEVLCLLAKRLGLTKTDLLGMGVQPCG